MNARSTMGLVAALAVLLATACGQASSGPAQSSSAGKSWPEKEEFERTVLPAAKKEGQVNYYTCTTTDEAEARIKAFNKFYPDIKVNYVYAATAEGVEKVTAELKAGRMVADLWQCGGQSGMTVRQNGAAEESAWIPPATKEPGVEWNWNVTDIAAGGFPIPMASLAGLMYNTNLVPADKVPASWKDLLADPWWQENLRNGKVSVADPRRPGHGNYYVNAFLEKYASDYGEAKLRELAALRPTRVVGDAGEVLRGEHIARLFTGIRKELVDEGAPVKMVCPAPGCNIVLFTYVMTKNGPNPNAAKVFINFFLTQEGQQVLGDWAQAVARKDVTIPEKYAYNDYRTQPTLFWPDQAAEAANRRALDWLRQTRIFDY